MSDFAIFQTGGKQYRVATGDIIKVEKLNAEGNVEFDQVLMVGDKIGTPFVEGAKVVAEVVKNGKGKKINVFTYRTKKGSKRALGHRQPYTKLLVKAIEG